jgi:saccharopine dehydrogenase-like NADP-dependent oxidoreductase
MTQHVLVLGGRGHIGRGVVADLLAHTSAQITITGRTAATGQELKNYPGDRVQFLALDLANQDEVRQAIAAHHLVIHCAGPFRYRDASVLNTCITHQVNYVDVSDDRTFTQTALSYREAAQQAGVTAIINTGVFPGISNSLARQGVEHLDQVEEIHLSYAVGGSGGAGSAVLQTTFLTLQHPFPVWVNGQWQTVKPYTGREAIQFPVPYGKTGVYWFDMPESFTLVDSFPVQTVTVKFGTIPDLYNHLTWLMANGLPAPVLQHPQVIQVLSTISRAMTTVSDRFSGTGVALRAEISGQKEGQPTQYWSTFTYPSAAQATGLGAGLIAQFILSGNLIQPGVWSVEQALPTPLFAQAMEKRGIKISSALSSTP